MSRGIPITRRQTLVWLEDKLHPEVPNNHVLTRVEIQGPLDPAVFQRAFARVVARHDALRAVLEEGPGGPAMRVLEEPARGVEIVDLSGSSDPAGAYHAWLQEFCREVFKPAAPLYSAALVTLDGERFKFHLNVHHAITDGQSLVVFYQELSEFYTHEEGSAAEAQPDRASDSFSDFLAAAAEYASSDAAKESEAFWDDRFRVAPDPVRFYGRGTHYKRALIRRAERFLGSELSEKIWQLRSEVPISLLFATVLFAYLRRVTTNHDLSIGVSLLNREPRFRETMGLLMEICPNRVNVAPEDSFASLLGKVREEVAAIRPHRGHTVTSRKAGYEVMLNLHPVWPQTLGGRPIRLEATTPLNHLESLAGDEEATTGWTGRESLAVQVHHDGKTREFTLCFDFNLGVWPEEALRERAADHFLILLEHFVAGRRDPIDALELLTPEERARLLPPEASAEQRGESLATVVEWFEEQVARGPDRPAIRFEDTTLSYAELDRQVKALSARLRGLGVGPNLLVGVCLERSPTMVVALLATMRAGGAYVPIDPKHPQGRIGLILEDADPLVVLSESGLRQKLGDAFQDRVVFLDVEAEDEAELIEDDEEIVAGDLAYVIFTSGSTGRPKGVQVRHHGLSTFLRAMAKNPGLGAEDRLLAVTTVSFDIAALELFLPLVVGASLRIAPYESTINPAALLELISRDRITVLQATPATFRMLITGGWEDTPELRILCGGEALPYELAQQMLERSAGVWNLYGPTETTIWSSVKQVQRGEDPVSLGHAIEGTQLYVLNERLQPVPIGVPGELYIAGDGVARGYHGREDLTRERFVPNPFSERPDARMYRTGDLVRFLPNLELEYLGRVDFQVKIRGFRVELGEIESILESFEGLDQCVVVARPDPSGEQSLVAYVVPAGDSALPGAEIRDHLRSKLPAYMVPSAVVNLDALPLTPNGKIDRKALPAPSGEETSLARGEYVAPRNDFESSLAAVWGRVLGVDRVGIRDDFFDLGGHSILALTLVNEIERVMGIVLDLGMIFSAPTIEQLVEAMDSDVAAQAWCVVPLQTDGDGTPLFCLCGIDLYRDLANALGKDRPVFGIYVSEEQAILEQAVKGKAADVSVERLASAYREAIQHQQPEGPYQLAGLSFGGVIAVETARLLRKDGNAVAIVALLDTVLKRGIQRRWTRWTLWHLRKLVSEGPGYHLSRIAKRVRGKRGRPGATLGAGGEAESAANAAMVRELAYIKAMTDFDTGVEAYDGDVVLMRALDDSRWGPGTELLRDYGWRSLVSGRLEIRDVPGDHIGIVKNPHAERLAGELRPYLVGSISRKPGGSAC